MPLLRLICGGEEGMSRSNILELVRTAIERNKEELDVASSRDA
jgi:hypothetical protein